MRIRTIKPEFFLHDGLFEAERETSLPLRLAYAGIWCACDRDGRFKWEPRRLGVSILPYDEIDFSRVLDALMTRGWLVKYRVGDAWYGAVPSWKKHQFVNPREIKSEIPDVSVADELDASTTRQPRVDVASRKEGKGKEGKGSTLAEPAATANGADPRHHEITSRWSALFTEAHGGTYAFSGRDAASLKRLLSLIPDSADDILSIAKAAWERSKTDRFAKNCKIASTLHGLCVAYNEIRVELQSLALTGTDRGWNQ